MSQNQSTSNQKRPTPVQNNKQAPNQNRSAPNQKKPAQNPPKTAPNQKRPAPTPQKAPKTQAFNAVNNKNKSKKPTKPSKKLIIAVCVVIVLILATLLVLIVGNIMNKIQHPATPEHNTTTYVKKSADDINIGNLLWFTKAEFKNMNLEKVTNEYVSKNFSITIGDSKYPIYKVNNDTSTYLEINTLNAFNALIKQYCVENILSANDIVSAESASNIQIAWGAYTEKSVYEKDIESETLGLGYAEHILGTSITIRVASPNKPITETMLKKDFLWIYENAHKYGFIISFPNKCTHLNNENGDDPYHKNDRLHLRYVGVEHATYIHENENVNCLKEYLDLLRTNHGYNNPLTVNANGKDYQVYYVQCNANPTQIPVPKDSTYTISGDNMNGFIITVEK